MPVRSTNTNVTKGIDDDALVSTLCAPTSALDFKLLQLIRLRISIPSRTLHLDILITFAHHHLEE